VLHEFVNKAKEYADTMEVETLSLRTGLLSNTAEILDTLAPILSELRDTIKSTTNQIEKELPSSLLEPNFGFANKLEPSSLSGLLKEIRACVNQVNTLVATLKAIDEHQSDQESLVFQEIDWTLAFATSLGLLSSQMDTSCQALCKAFPDGRLRPQEGTSCSPALNSITAAATFRDFRDVRFQVISIWSSNFQELKNVKDTLDMEDTLLLGITTSSILELARHLQLAGKELEAYAKTFPS
jgi:hypothetical protein